MPPITGIIAFARSPVAKWLGLALVVAGACWGGYHAIYSRGVASCERVHSEALAKAVELAQAEARAIALQDAEVIYSGLAERERIRVVYRDREKEIVKHVPIDCNQCRFTPSGIGLLNNSLNDRKSKTPNTGSQPPTSSQSQPPGGDRNLGGNGSIVDNRQWKVL